MDTSKMTPEELFFHRRHSPGFNPLEGFGIISKQQWDESQARIAELEAELELRTKERDQAIDCGGITVINGKIYTCDGKSLASQNPELYAHLAGMGK